MIALCDFGLRRDFAEAAMGEKATAYWIEHYTDCPAWQGNSCACGLIVWFWSGRKVVSIDGTLREQLQLVQ